MDSEQIVLEADGSQVKREVDAANKSITGYGETVIRVSDRSKNSIDRLVTSMMKQADVYGKTGVDKLIAQRDSLVARYANEQRAVDAITKSYGSMIDAERKLVEQQRQAEEASRRATEQRKQEAEQARRAAEEAKKAAEEQRLAESQKSHFSARYALLGAKDIFEGRGTFAVAEGANLLGGLAGSALAIGATTAAFAGLLLASKASATALGEFGQEMQNLHLRTGIATADVNQFAYAAKVVGQDATIYERMMRGLSEALGENSREGDKARQTLSKLGVEVRDNLTGDLKSPTDVLLNISRALNTLPEGFQRDAAAMDLFKRAGIEALPVINSLEQSYKRAGELHLGIKDEDLKRWHEYKEQMDEAGARWDVLKRSIMEPLAATWNITLKAGGKIVDSGVLERILAGPFAGARASNQEEGFSPAALTDDNRNAAIQAAREGRIYNPSTPNWVNEANGRNAKIAARQSADAYIRSMGSAQSPEERLHQAEADFSKLSRPVVGASSLEEAKAFDAAQKKVESLKEQIKYTHELGEEAKRLQSFENSMGQRDLGPAERMRQQLADFLAPHAGQAALSAGQRAQAKAFTEQAIRQEQRKAELQEDDQAGRRQREFVTSLGERELSPTEKLQQSLKDYTSDPTKPVSGKDRVAATAVYMDAFAREMAKEAEKILVDGARQIEENVKAARNRIQEQDKQSLDIYSAQAQHLGRLSSINSRKDGFGAEFAAVQQEFQLKQHIRDIEMAMIQAHAGAYDVAKEQGRIDLENAKDRYAMEEQIAELRKKEFEEVEKTTERLVNTLLTKPGSFSKQLGETVHAAILQPITHGISTMLSSAITPVIYGRDGKSGIAGALSGAFGGGRNADPVKLSTDNNTGATIDNTRALYAMMASMSNGGGRGPAAPGTPGGASVGSAGSAVANSYTNPSSSSFLSLGAFGATAALSGFLAHSEGNTQRQSNRNLLAGVGASFGRGQSATYSPMTFTQRSTWAPGAAGAVGALIAGGFSGGGAPSLINPSTGGSYSPTAGADVTAARGGGYAGRPGGSSPLSIKDITGFEKTASGIIKQGTTTPGGWAKSLASAKGTVWNQEAFDKAGGGVGGTVSAIGKSPAAGAAGFALANAGLLGNRRGTWGGIAEGTAGGALIGFQIGGPVGAAVGAAVGFGIGVGEKLAGVESPQNEAKRLVKQIYGISIDNKMAAQIVALAGQKYGNKVSIAVRDPEVRQMIQLYATGTGQGSKFPISSTTPFGVSTSEVNGKLYQNTSYQLGQSYNYQSSLPVYGGAQGTTLAGPSSSIVLNVNGQSAADLLAGKVADTVTPGYVQDSFASSMSYSQGRVSNSATIQQPGLITS